jgi:hypothetical protein
VHRKREEDAETQSIRDTFAFTHGKFERCQTANLAPEMTDHSGSQPTRGYESGNTKAAQRSPTRLPREPRPTSVRASPFEGRAPAAVADLRDALVLRKLHTILAEAVVGVPPFLGAHKKSP